MKASAHVLGTFWIILAATTAHSAEHRIVNLGPMRITSVSTEGSTRAAVVLRGPTTPYLRFDCSDLVQGFENRGDKNTLIVVDTAQSMGVKKHELFTAGYDFYCQGISKYLFGNLKVGDSVQIRFEMEIRKDDFRGGTETALIQNIIVTPTTGKPRSYLESPSVRSEFTSTEYLNRG